MIHCFLHKRLKGLAPHELNLPIEPSLGRIADNVSEKSGTHPINAEVAINR